MTPIKSARYALPLLLTLTMGLGGYAGDSQATKLYKWVDDDGQVHYSSTMPAKQKKKKHQELNKSGFVVNTTEDAKSDEERAADALAKQEADKKAKEDARLKAIQDEKDKVLLLTFSSEEELSLARDNRIDVLDSVISLINKSIVSTQEKLDQLQNLADTNYLSQGKEVPGGLAQKIEHFTRKIENRNAQLELKQSEKDKINEQFELDLARYRELRSTTN